MAGILVIHRLRGREGRAGFEFDCEVCGTPATFYWRQDPGAWRPETWRGQCVTAAQIAKNAGADEAGVQAEIEAAARMCEAEYLRLDPPALRAVA